MTYYYYVAADIELNIEQYNEQILSLEKSTENSKGFDVTIQLEIYNGVDKKRKRESLLASIYQQAERYKRCIFQIANLVNSNRVSFKITEKAHIAAQNQIRTGATIRSRAGIFNPISMILLDSTSC